MGLQFWLKQKKILLAILLIFWMILELSPEFLKFIKFTEYIETILIVANFHKSTTLQCKLPQKISRNLGHFNLDKLAILFKLRPQLASNGKTYQVYSHVNYM